METLTTWKAATVVSLRKQLQNCPAEKAIGVILTTMSPPVPAVAVVKPVRAAGGVVSEIYFWRVRFDRMPPEHLITPLIERFKVSAANELSIETNAPAIGSEMDVLVLEQLTGASINRFVSHHSDTLLSLAEEQ